MSQLRRILCAILIVACAGLFSCVFAVVLSNYNNKNSVVSGLSVGASAVYEVSVENASSFTYDEYGLYLTRPEIVSAGNVYTGNIFTDELIGDKSQFSPEDTEYHAMVMVNDKWEKILSVVYNSGEWQTITYDSYYADCFWVEQDDPTNYSIKWCLRETAPAAVYGVRCSHLEQGNTIVTDTDFRVLYKGDWTYINITNNKNERRIVNFPGGRNLTLSLFVGFNSGASDPDLNYAYDPENQFKTGVVYGALSSGNVVNTQSMVWNGNISVRTVSGKVYETKNLVYGVDSNVPNQVDLRFLQSLGNDIYIIQFTSDADSHILGQFVIDNSGMKSGVNLSQLWVVLTVFGGLLVIGASLAYLVPLCVVKFNEARVYRENERIARIKNPEAYMNKDKKSIKEIFKKIIYNIKTPVYKRKKEAEENAKKQQEEKVYSNRFTEMLRERQEKREYMRINNLTSEELEKIKEKEAAMAADKLNSFASLRDVDDEDDIATFHAAQEEISTLETGAFVEGGARFAKLDSMQDDGPTGDGNNSGN